MSFHSMRQLRLSEDITRTPSLPKKNKQIPNLQNEFKHLNKRSLSENTIKLPQILSPKQQNTNQEKKYEFQAKKMSTFGLNNKLDKLLGDIDQTLKEEIVTTRQIRKSIHNQITLIDDHFKGKIKVSQKEQMEKVMFSENEKIKVVNQYNITSPQHYTNTNSGIKYFKKNILQKEDQFGYSTIDTRN